MPQNPQGQPGPPQTQKQIATKANDDALAEQIKAIVTGANKNMIDCIGICRENTNVNQEKCIEDCRKKIKKGMEDGVEAAREVHALMRQIIDKMAAAPRPLGPGTLLVSRIEP